jgi:predicted extracellular nuclease
MKLHLIIVIFFTVNTTFSVKGQNEPGGIRLMFYNVENAFDTSDDPATEDNEFLPGGVRRWTNSRYENKLNNIYKTIVAAGEGQPPEIIGFCEIENSGILKDLISKTYLSKFNYGIIHEDSRDRRGIDVCMLYRKDILKLSGYDYWIPEGLNREEFSSRSVLYAKLSYGNDTLHVILNHWPSRRGGVLSGEPMRRLMAAMVRSKVDSISERSTIAKIIITGDFNSTPAESEMKLLLGSVSGTVLVNLSTAASERGEGTYRYQGIWEVFDQVIVSEDLINSSKGFSTGQEDMHIFKPGFLLADDPVYPGPSPFPTYKGYRYQGGFSDHLPVLLFLHPHDLPGQIPAPGPL